MALRKINFEYSGYESASKSIFKSDVREILGKCVIKIDDELNGTIIIKTNKSKKELIKDLLATEPGYDSSSLSDWEFS